MSELNAIRNAVRAEREIIKAERAAKATTQITKAGKAVDVSKGFNVRAPDGTVIPFRPGTDLDKAKVWVSNFYKKDFEFVDAKKPVNTGQPKGWEGTEEYSVLRDPTDRHTYIQFADLDTAYRVQFSFLPGSKRGQGIGAGMYRKLFERAKKEGKTVQSDSRMSEDSIAIWKRFKDLGYPIKDNSAKAKKAAEGGMYETSTRDPLFEYDPADVKITPQAGQVPNDPTPTTGMLVKPQAGEARPSNMSKVDPGLYFDEDSKSYVQVADDGSIKKVDLNEAN